MSEMLIHEAANIFPMDEATIPALVEDIRRKGQLETIKLYDGQVLDGRRRLRACDQLGIVPRIEDVDVAANPDPIAYAWSINEEGRRHLNVKQKAMVAARMRVLYDKQAKERQRLSQGRGKKGPVNLPDLSNGTGDARDLVGKVVGVSGKTVDFATRVLKQGTPKLIAAVDAGRLAPSTAAEVLKGSRATQDERADKALERGRRGYKALDAPAAGRVDGNGEPPPPADPREVKEALKKVRGKARQIYNGQLKEQLSRLKKLLHADRATYAPTLMSDAATVIDREIKKLFKVFGVILEDEPPPRDDGKV